jgi:hypothetical protein
MNPIIDGFGTKYWYNDFGEYHREKGPALEYSDGTKFWYINNKMHRKDGPAVEHRNGYKEWWVNGKLHREDGPAIEDYNKKEFWFIHGELIDCKNNEEFLRIVRIIALL